jgi:hypothetical protein
MAGDPLETGWYPLMVEKVLGTDVSKKGAPTSRVQLKVVEGECEGRRAFVTVVLGAASYDKEDQKRSAVELAKANKTIQGQMKGFIGALGVTTGQPTGTGKDMVFGFYNVGSWEGRTFVGKIRKRAAEGPYPESNQLDAYHNNDDEKRGLAWWRAQSGGASASAAPQAQAL